MKKENAIAFNTSEAAAILDGWHKGAEIIEQSCRRFVTMIDASDNARLVYDEFIKLRPELNYNRLITMEKIGRGQIYVKVLLDGSPGAKKLLKLPASLQREYYDKSIKVVSIVDGKTIVEEKTIQQLSNRQAGQVFDGDRMRTIDEQIAKAKLPEPTRTDNRARRYEIVGDRLNVRAVQFDIATLRDIISQMEAEALKRLGASMKKNQIK